MTSTIQAKPLAKQAETEFANSPWSSFQKLKSGKVPRFLGALMAVLTLCVDSANAVSLWPSATPINPTNAFDPGDINAYEFGVRFKSTVNGTVTGIRFYKVTANTGPHFGSLWTDGGTRLAVTNFSGESASGWQQQNFATPIAITAGTVYRASYSCPSGGYSADLANDPGSLSAGVTNLPLIALPNSEGGNGVLASGTNNFPNSSANGINWWVDVVFSPAVDTNPPVVLSVSPPAGAANVQTNSVVTVTFNEAMLASTITTNTITLTNTTTGTRVAATVTYSAGNATATLQPSSPLTLGQTYSAGVKSGASGAKDTATNALAADFAWSFTATTFPSVSLFDPATTPPVVNGDSLLTLGVKFKSTQSGFIKGIRFYKGVNNTGTHTGTLWTDAGARLAEATFVGETASGWQEQLFSSPVAIQSNTVYVASYFAPNGNYAATTGFFATQGATNSPLIAPPTGDVAGGNGVFDDAALENAFPTSTFNAANYWVDVVYVSSLGPDTNAPTVISTLPASNATGVSLIATVQATFNEPMLTNTITTNTFQLRNAGNVLIPATVTYNSGSQTAVLQPLSALGVNQTYTARVISGVNGVKDTATNALASDYVWNFTTTANVGTNLFGTNPPTGTLSADDTSAVELGVKFKSAAGGFIRGIRFYKGTNNVGTHIGNLWAADGTPLGTVTFSNETATGWQQQLFSSPVPITSNTTYIASYFAPSGGYAFDSFFFSGKGVTNYPLRALPDGEDGQNGVFNASGVTSFPNQSFNAANYWVDVVYTDQNTPPTAGIVSRTFPEDTSTNLTLIGSDAEGAVTFSLVSNPAHGLISNFNTNTGTLTYTPDTNYFGADTFNYRVSDGSLFATGTVDLTITGVDDPLFANNQSFALAKDTSTNLVLSATDPDGNPLVLEVLPATDVGSSNNWSAIGTSNKVVAVAVNDGTTTYIQSSTTVPTVQQFQLTDPKYIQPGDPISSVTLRSTAQRSGSGSTSFRTAVVLGATASYGTSRGVGSSFADYEDEFGSRPGSGAWTLTDVQNVQMRIENTSRSVDCTKFDAYVTFQGNTNRSYTILSGPAHGSIIGLNTNNGSLTYTPTLGYMGPDSFTFRVSSGGIFVTGLVSITLTGNSSGPVLANPIGTQNATYGTDFNFMFPTDTFSDVDSPTLSYNATGMPPGIGFTGGTRTFAGTPSASGNYPVTLIAADSTPLYATNVFNINVAKGALSVTASNLSKPYGVPLSFVGNEFFTTGLKLSDTATSATLGSTGSPANAAAGPYPITVTNVVGLGLTNYTVSYFDGTLTVTPSAPYSITAIGVTNNIATITWQSISGRVYRLEYKDDLTTPSWTEVPADVISSGSSTTATNGTGGTTHRFYRVK